VSRQPVVVVVSTWPWGYRRPYMHDVDRLAWALIGWPLQATAWLLVWSLVAVAWLAAEFYCLLGSLIWYVSARVQGGQLTIEKMRMPLGLHAWATLRKAR
jgi:hypothetical protein